jgi:outer membrane protein
LESRRIDDCLPSLGDVTMTPGSVLSFPRPLGFILAAALCCWLTFIPTLQAQGEALSLAQSVDLAHRNNPALEEARARIAQARAALGEASAPFWPQLTASVEYLRGDAPSAFLFKTIDARRLPPEVDFNRPGTFENVETAIAAQWNLYRGGRDQLVREQAREHLARQEHEHEALRNELTATVIDTFFAILTARDFVAITQQTESTVARELELAEVRFAGGSLLRSDVLSLQVRLAEAQAEKIQAASAQQRLAAALATLLDRPADDELRLVALEEISYTPPTDYSQALERALRQRPELAAMTSQRVTTRLQQDLARAEYLPRLDLQARLYHGDAGLSFDDQDLNWTFGAVLSWEFFSGFATPARQAQARAGAAEAAAAERRLRRQIELNVRQSWFALEEATARLEVTRIATMQAEEALALVRTQFAAGAAEVTRYLNAQLALARMQATAAAAHWERQRSLSELARSIGDWVSSNPLATGTLP